MFTCSCMHTYYCIVSILVFVELALDVGYMERTSRRHKFQSLFSWNLLLMVAPPGRHWLSGSPVSILVFVELALDAIGKAAGLMTFCCFPWKTKKNQMQEASYPPPSDDLFWSGLFTEISSSARKRAFFRLLSLIP